MSTRKIWNGTQWVQIGTSIDDIEIVTSSASAVDPSKLYFVASGATPGDLVTFRVNGKLGSGVWFGGNELWTPTQQATGGTETIIDVAGTPYRVHTFTTSGDFEVLIPSLSIEYLVVAGGGAGGYKPVTNYSGAGGGAGGVLTGAGLELVFGAHNITVGGGGIATIPGNNGENSSISTLVTAIGGGKGGANSPGGSGGSGGGAGYSSNFGAGTTGQGYAGGSTTPTGPVYLIGAGGGGASSAGASVSSSSNTTPRANGGSGLSSSISGIAITYASGGKGGAGTSHAQGNLNGDSGMPNTGSGGGGAGAGPSATIGGQGGSGIVIIRYPAA
ncbi:hypothetical protein KC968_03795 [Candidatus Saccharibacteria bacterium]|nr:hypothetical protein [Candidatus Saccharibacteria bacterium]